MTSTNPPIDWSKPIEFDNGQPAKLLKSFGSSYSVTPVEQPFVTPTYTYEVGGCMSFGRSGKHIMSDTYVRNKAPQLDWSKPLETVDGHPVELMGASALGRYRVKWDGSMGERSYKSDGKHFFGRLPDIRNVVEPTLNLTEPLQTVDGKRVKYVSSLDDGRIVVEVFYTGSIFNAPSHLEYRFGDGRKSQRPGQTSGDDVINRPVLPVSTYHNVYSDGSTGKTPHKSYESARDYSKVGKERVGILEIVKKNDAVFSSKYTAGTPYTRATSDLRGGGL